jgi:hypothetical protein
MLGPTLWASGQSSWLQIQRSGCGEWMLALKKGYGPWGEHRLHFSDPVILQCRETERHVCMLVTGTCKGVMSEIIFLFTGEIAATWMLCSKVKWMIFFRHADIMHSRLLRQSHEGKARKWLTDNTKCREHYDKKARAISVTDRERPLYCETSKLPHFLDCKVVSLTRRPTCTHRKSPGTHFC